MNEPYPPSRPKPGDVVLTEEVPGVPQGERWYLWKHGSGKLWEGATEEAGRLWAEANATQINYLERFGGY